MGVVCSQRTWSETKEGSVCVCVGIFLVNKAKRSKKPTMMLIHYGVDMIKSALTETSVCVR